MTPDQLSAIRERLDAATPGNWTAKHEAVTTDVGEWGLVAETLNDTDEQRAADARLIANAPTDLRALLDEVKRLTTLLAGTEAVLENEREYQARLKAEVVELHADPLPAAAWVREVQQAAFRRGAEAMRTALLQRVSWGSDLADRIRAEPVPEDK